MKKFSPLELLHPDGSANTSFVLGSDCPESLFPETNIGSEQKAELFVLAPSVKECRSDGWLEGAANSVAHRLSHDGVCYVLVPPPWRRRLIRLLSEADLVIDTSFWHFPDWTSSRYLVPLQRGPAQFAVENIFSAPPWKRILASEMFRFPGARKFLSLFWRSAGITVRHHGARPLFQWLFKRQREKDFPGAAMIRTSWRGIRGATITYCFTKGDLRPSLVTKTSFGKDSWVRLDREAEILEAVGPCARIAGAHVPQILQKEHHDPRLTLFLSTIHGRPSSDLLASRPGLLVPILTKLVAWLERWHFASVKVRPLNTKQLERDFFSPIKTLAPLLENADGYRDWLTERLQAAVGSSIPFVASHNDLTMANVLVAVHDRLGVIDWETGMAESWPLVDFYYSVTDAVRIVQGYTDWLDAFRACYEQKGSYTSDVNRWEQRLRSAIKLSSDLAELCFHACWLHHASNEHLVSRPGDPRPFLQIVQWLALNYSRPNENRN